MKTLADANLLILAVFTGFLLKKLAVPAADFEKQIHSFHLLLRIIFNSYLFLAREMGQKLCFSCFQANISESKFGPYAGCNVTM